MTKTVYISFSDVNELQTNIMKFVGIWVHQKKTPVPRSEIIKSMQSNGVNMPTTRNALYSLIKKGYIREAVTISNKTTYVALRTI
jgi:hypothetical protein